jgi:hypothetical protein
LDRGKASSELRTDLVFGLGQKWLMLLVVALMGPFCSNAQLAGTGTIEGTVTDSTGALVPGAKVTARSVATGSETVRNTTGSGDYTLAPLNAGDYTVTVSATGFETWYAKTFTWMDCRC